ncbi:hypothetical protein MC7420_5458 [Coleofasciculus chthonoplastes PCC 7420]|uniref:Uncharacterized protein n=1 Tax=Coleofasciculus chthonoplastes PCC 7420 TaxID=118168 RepID=B4VQ53_9CYAN|nr:hypothetical protein MC7420_5458 [Coleofasciculus chthonoplastes PCC 7420]
MFPFNQTVRIASIGVIVGDVEMDQSTSLLVIQITSRG